MKIKEVYVILKKKGLFMIEKFLNKNVVEVPQSGIRRFFDLVTGRTDSDTVSLVIGEPDFITPEDIRKAGIEAIEKGKTQYTSNWGLPELREAICKYLKMRYRLDYDPSCEVFASIGASEAIDLTLRALIAPGDEVLIPDPSYVAYAPCTLLNYGVPVTVKTEESQGFRITPENLEKAITPKSKVLVVPYPSNPTGAVMGEEELRVLLPVIKKHDLIVITDEIYSELTYGVRHVSIASFEGMKERTVYVSSFSKSFAMTGWRVGYVCGPEELMKQMIKIRQYTTVCPSTISQYACTAALEQGFKNDFKEVAAMREQYNARRRFVYRRLTEMGLPLFEPKGAFYAFPNISVTGLTGQEFALKILDEMKVVIVPGDAFGSFGKDFVRISYAYSMDKLEEGLDRIEKFVVKMKQINGKQ